MEENNRGEGTNMFRIYRGSMLLSIVQFICTIYTRYTRGRFQSAPYGVNSTRSFENCIIIFPPRSSRRLWFPRVAETNYGKKLAKVKGFACKYVNNLHGIIRRTRSFFSLSFFQITHARSKWVRLLLQVARL